MIDLNKINAYPSIDVNDVTLEVNRLLDGELAKLSDVEFVQLVDIAFLADNESNKRLEGKLVLTRKLYDLDHAFRFASICVYPNYVAMTKKYMKNTNTMVAAVTGNFPTGQTLRKNKLQETRQAIDEGADEIDFIYSIGDMLDENYQEIDDELNAVREVCGKVPLKMILETGRLTSLKDVRIASEIALQAGVDFIKTSTGKYKIGATLEAAYVILQAIKEHHDATSNKVGVKFSGGISSKAQARQYLKLTEQIVGGDWLTSSYFRVGAGNMAFKLLNARFERLKNTDE